MVTYLLRRTFSSVVVLLLASVIIFFLVDGLTGGLSGFTGSSYVRYAAWMGGLLRGNLGTSPFEHTSVNEIVAVRAWPTVLLMGTSLALTALLAVPFGTYAAIKRHHASDRVGRTFFFVGYSLPGFWLGAMLQLVFGVYLTVWAGTKFFYISGISTPGNGGLLDVLQHLTLPVLALSLASMAQFARFQRGAMVEALSADYVRTARAKGLGRSSVNLKHALRNALVPTVTLFALGMGALAGGAIFIEVVFSWPGLGLLLIEALIRGDYEIVRALLMINAVFVVFFNLLADLSYAFLDPRVSYE